MHYLISLIVPILILYAQRKRIDSIPEACWWAAVSTVGMYVVSVTLAFITSSNLDGQLESFDLNHDGVFSPDEQTDAQRAAEFAAINDSGRNLSVIFAIPWSALVSASLFLPVGWINRKPRRSKKRASKDVSADQ